MHPRQAHACLPRIFWCCLCAGLGKPCQGPSPACHYILCWNSLTVSQVLRDFAYLRPTATEVAVASWIFYTVHPCKTLPFARKRHLLYWHIKEAVLHARPLHCTARILLYCRNEKVVCKTDLEVPSLKKAPFGSIVMISAVRCTYFCHVCRGCRSHDACTSAFQSGSFGARRPLNVPGSATQLRQVQMQAAISSNGYRGSDERSVCRHAQEITPRSCMWGL